jgi:hypothetical protein
MVCRLENGGRNRVCPHAVLLLCISLVSQCLSWPLCKAVCSTTCRLPRGDTQNYLEEPRHVIKARKSPHLCVVRHEHE